MISFILGIAIVYESPEPDSLAPLHSVPSPLQGNNIEASNLTTGYQSSSTDFNNKQPCPQNSSNRILDLFKDFASISNRVILWIVYLAPWCIAFLIAGSISQAGDIGTVIQGVAVYVLATITGILIHLSISLPLVFFFYTGENPYIWMYTCRKAMLIAFSTSSSVYHLFYSYLDNIIIGCNITNNN